MDHWSFYIWWPFLPFHYKCDRHFFNIVDEDDDDVNVDELPEQSAQDNSAVPTNIRQLSTSQIQAVVSEYFDMSCEKCDTTFSGFDEAKSHYQFAHNIARGYVKCCDLKLREHKNYRGHILWHLNPHVFEWVFLDECWLNRLPIKQIVLLLCINFSCLICGSSYKNLQSYHRHKHFHKNRALKRFICDICNAEFALKQQLIYHIMKVHAAKKRYFCEMCRNK